MVSTQEFAYLGQSWVVILLQQFLALFLCIHHHAAELIDIERLATQSYAFLAINGRTPANLDG